MTPRSTTPGAVTTRALRRLLRAAEPFTRCTAAGLEEAKRRAVDTVSMRAGAMPDRDWPHITPRRFLNLVEAVEQARTALAQSGHGAREGGA